MKPKTEYIIIKETALQSIISDCVTFGFGGGFVALGIWADSAVLQCIGGIALIITVLAKTSGHKRLTREQAIAKLEEMGK